MSMGDGSDGTESGRLSEARETALELLAQVSGPEMAASDLFPHGINQISISVRAGDVEVSVELSGPDHSHPDSHDEDWMEEDLDDLDGGFEDDEEELR